MNYFYEKINDAIREAAEVSLELYLHSLEVDGLYRLRSNLKLPVKALKFTGTGTIALQVVGTVNTSLKYSYDGITWKQLSSTPVDFTEIYVKGYNPKGLSIDTDNYCYFQLTGSSINCAGSVMELIGADTFTNRHSFYRLFYNCTSLATAPELPATQLTDYCYEEMFSGCTNLTIAPELPAKVINNFCYRGMFKDCTNLEAAPELPAVEVLIGSYSGMFEGCSNLSTAPELNSILLSLFSYLNMFKNCTGLQTAPELPSIGLVEGCYNYMFYGCSSLRYIKALFLNTPSDSATLDWVKGVAATGTFVKNSEATWEVTGDNGVPVGWTVEV